MALCRKVATLGKGRQEKQGDLCFILLSSPCVCLQAQGAPSPSQHYPDAAGVSLALVGAPAGVPSSVVGGTEVAPVLGSACDCGRHREQNKVLLPRDTLKFETHAKTLPVFNE